MISLLQTAAVLIIALAGMLIGSRLSRAGKQWWTGGYLIAGILTLIVIGIRLYPFLEFKTPFSLIAAGRTRFAVMGFAAALGTSSILSELRYKWQKQGLIFFASTTIICLAAIPFLAPSFLHYRHAALDTNIDSEGICRQNTSYTCGPAAAVTALRQLGFEAYEGEIAVHSNTAPFIGTSPVSLMNAMRRLYSGQGLACRYDYFTSVDQLQGTETMLAVIKDSTFSRHCVAVLGITEETVTIADPALGQMKISSKDFDKLWNGTGITLSRI